jgi:uncharacterized protein YciI
MPLFVILATDKPGALEARMAAREAHLAYLAGVKDMVLAAGPFLDAEGAMVGSMLVIEADDLGAAQAFQAADPYTQAGLFDHVEVRGWRMGVGVGLPGK